MEYKHTFLNNKHIT